MVLTAAAAFDRRTVDESTAQAWSAALPDIGPDEARDAVVAHYREKRDWIMPADIRAIVRRVRDKRLSELPPIAPPPELADNPALEAKWLREVRKGMRLGYGLEKSIESACRLARVPVPKAAAVTGPSLAARAALKQLMSSTEVDDA